MSEKQLQADIVRVLRAHRVHVSVLGTVRRRNPDGSRPHYGTQQTPGLPDLWLMWPRLASWGAVPIGGGGCWVEIKTPTGRTSYAQNAWHRAALDAGVDVYVWRSVDDALAWLHREGLRRQAVDPVERARQAMTRPHYDPASGRMKR